VRREELRRALVRNGGTLETHSAGGDAGNGVGSSSGKPTPAQLATWLNSAKLLEGRARMLRASIRTQCGNDSPLRALSDVAFIETMKLREALEPAPARDTQNPFPNGRYASREKGGV
jgi:hypothetical protein